MGSNYSILPPQRRWIAMLGRRAERLALNWSDPPPAMQNAQIEEARGHTYT